MRRARLLSSNIVCPLGLSTDVVFNQVCQGESAIKEITDFEGLQSVFASRIDNAKIEEAFVNISKDSAMYSRFEKLAILSLSEAAHREQIDLADPKLLIILCSTKGNIELLDRECQYTDRLLLSHSAKVITAFFSNPNAAVVISNACISGVVGLIEAQRYLMAGTFERVAVVGCDTLSKFVLSGFGCFKALASSVCRPFDSQRDGLNLGEAAGTVILDFQEIEVGGIYLAEGAITNDATHISAPSRTADGLYAAIKRCDTSAIDFISAHGTATPYNDPMEALAIFRSSLQEVPTLSLKAIFGHTLGAAGVVETIIGCRMLQEDILLPSFGFVNEGIEPSITISKELKRKQMKGFLKIISGFGGCNAALVIRKKS